MAYRKKYSNDRDRMRAIIEGAKRGGRTSSADRKHMAEIARLSHGGEVISKDRRHMAAIGQKGGEATSSDRRHMSKIGRGGGRTTNNRPAPKRLAARR